MANSAIFQGTDFQSIPNRSERPEHVGGKSQDYSESSSLPTASQPFLKLRCLGALFTRAFVATLIFAISAQSNAEEVAIGSGVEVPEVISVSRSEPTLDLLACGIRTKLWFVDLYAVSLYGPSTASESGALLPEQFLDGQTSKSARIDIVYDGDIPGDIPAAWRDYLLERLDPDTIAALARVLADVGRGDVVEIDYAEATGSTLKYNDRLVHETKNQDLIRAMVQLWIGDDPVSKRLSDELISGC